MADLDHATRRIGLLHTDSPGIERQLRSQRGLVDGVLCVSRRLVEIAQHCLPDLAAERIKFLPYPICPEPATERRKPLAGRPLVLGFCGRLIKEQKRVDRLPRLYRCLANSGLDFKFEIIGDGPALSWLKREVQNEANIRFHGRLTGTHYWRALNGCDVLIFVSDYEGLPISLLEALSIGILPLYPRINSGGDSYVAGLSPEFLFTPDDFQGVAAVLKRLQERSDEEVEELRAAAVRLAAPHSGEAYEDVFSSFVRYVANAERISASVFPGRPFYWTDYWPFALLSRLYPQACYRTNSG
ncbi:MAG: glycosyltransferase family 4 protein [Chloroflexi bacterium]|nr:glycosyltransferase family 4 protein [Chloroflexota bacterium]